MDELAESLCTQAADLAAAEYQWLVTLREFDDLRGWAEQGAKSCSHWLGWACGMNAAMARDRIRVARALRDLPVVSEQFAAGKLSFSKVRAICRVAVPENEELLVTYANHATAAQLERVCSGFRTARNQDLRAYEEDPDLGDEDPDDLTVAETRWVRRMGCADEGGVRLEVRLPADTAGYVLEVLAAVADQLGDELVSGVQGREDLSPGDQSVSAKRWWQTDQRHEVRLADALVVLAETAQAHGAAPVDADQRAQLNLIVKAEALAADAQGSNDALSPPSSEAASEIDSRLSVSESATGNSLGVPAAADSTANACVDQAEGSAGSRRQAAHAHAAPAQPPEPDAYVLDGTEVGLSTALRVACDASVIALVEDALGNPLGVGRKTRQIPTGLKRALRRRDHGCRFPGCTTRRFTDAHHIQHWAHGGPTELENLVLLCRFHHTLIHEGGFGINVQASSQLQFLRPDRTPIPPVAPTQQADLGRYNTVAHDPDRGADALIPDWDGHPQDYNCAIFFLDKATPFPASTTPEPPEDVTAETPAAIGN